MLIDLIRHTTPDIDQGICYGQSDLDLIDGYQIEFAEVHAKILTSYDAVISSPLQRCYKLAQTLGTKNLEQDPRIMEYNFGDWELTPWSEFKSQQAENWMNNFVDQPAPNGDSILTMQARVLDFWRDLSATQYEKVAVVTHSGVQRLLHAHILKTPLTHIFRLELGYGAVIRLTHKAEINLTTLKHL